MPVGYGEVKSWRAAPLGQAGDGVRADAKVLEESRDQVEAQAIPASWTGLARYVAEFRRDALVRSMTTHLEGKRQVQRALYDAETLVTDIERLVADVEGQAKAGQFEIGDDGSVTDVSEPRTFDSRWEAEEHATVRRNQAQALADDVTAILVRAAAADATIADSIPSGHVQDVDEYGTADPDVAARWAQLSDTERRAVIEQMIEELSEDSGLEMPEIVWEDESWGSNGSWSDGEPGTLRLNEGLLDDPRLLHTVAHEVRHGRQHEAVRDENDWQFPWESDPFDEHRDDGITADQANSWEDNFENYQDPDDPGVSYEDYFTQPVEDDARDAGREYLDGLTEAEIDRLLEEAR
ncbi:hypothetical protein [Nocardioides caricicola]|uniref:Uncharacterized protein n=1 Tax=Nocardioides caricicola TaxID=634770 RepID=A0ABW0N893_9ACTN